MITEEFISRYFTDRPPVHEFYKESIEVHDKLLVHSKGIYPQELMEVSRPNEADEYKEYRKNVFVPKTKPWFSKVVKTIAKGHRAEDWGITWKPEVKGAIPKDETLQQYCTVNYPYFDSFENWLFSIALPMMLEDPDGVIAVYPLAKKTESDTEYLRPYTFYFPCERVIDYKENQYAVLLDDEKSEVKVGDKIKEEGMILHFFDTESYFKAVQVGEKDKYQFTVETDQEGNILPSVHNIGYLPVIKLGGTVKEFSKGETLWDSFIADCIDSWNEALRRYSDHQVNMVLHLHPFEWEMADTPCKVCKGTGKEFYMKGQKKIEHKCGHCDGAGNISIKTPFGKKVIRPAVQNGVNTSTAIPTPPAGIIERDIGSIEFLKKEYHDQIREGLAAINMEWIADKPLNVSGESKDKDRQETITFLHEVFRHLISNVAYPCVYFISKWRYPTVSESDIEANLPAMKTPTKFDFVTADLVGDRLKTAIESKFNPIIVNKLNIEYAKKELGDDCFEINKMEVMNQLDPLPNKTAEEKMTAYATKAISLESYILSENLAGFIEKAISNDEKFLTKTYAEQNEALKPFIQETIKSRKANTVTISEEV